MCSGKDHLPKTAESQRGTGSAQGTIDQLDLESVQKSFEADLLRLSSDQAKWADYEMKISAGQRALEISKILHLKAENKRGSQLVVQWMERWCRFAANSYADEHLNIIEAWLRATQPKGFCLQLKVQSCFQALVPCLLNSPEWLGSLSPGAIVVFMDYTKCGCLQQDKLDETTEAIRRLLNAYGNKSVAILVAPTLVSSKVVGGKRGECRCLASIVSLGQPLPSHLSQSPLLVYLPFLISPPCLNE